MKAEDFCDFIFKLREDSISRADMARKYPWHKNTIIGYEKDRLPDIDYLYAVSKETGYLFGDLIRMRLQAGILQLPFDEAALLVFDSPEEHKIALELENKSFLIEDDSMAPTILNGSHVTVDLLDISLNQGSIYAFEINNQIVPRRIQYGLNNEIMLLPENTKFKMLTLPKNDINKLQIIGRVSSCINPL